ncbi:MAG: tRNA dihydrouridine synthase DusB [Firmicutes bacterium]|nr:tRNA dihydrouridine synthase DusB [Bacillota bacterium]
MTNKKVNIGGIQFDNPYFLAPLAGITDGPFRRICKKFGAGAVYSEMISAKGLYYNDQVTEKLLKIYDDETPLIYQIFGSDPSAMAYAADILSSRKNCMIDINMGCPVPKVVKSGDGSALLKNPELVSEVVEAVVKKARKPVTVKIRIGWDENHINAVEIAKRIEDAGAAAIGVHGRTRTQMYSGTADRSVIRQVKESVSIPVIGNGDIFGVDSCQSMFEETGCDAVMIARGALGNPWIFRSLLEGKDYVPSRRERVDIIKEHFGLLLEEKGEYVAVRSMRKHIGWYVKGLPGAVAVRRNLNQLEDASDIMVGLERLVKEEV